MLFDKEKANHLEKKLITQFGMEKKISILTLLNNPDHEIHDLADYIYQNIFLFYTMKQWGKKPEQIDPNIVARVPIFISRDNRYFQDPYQGIPTNGFTSVINNMINHPNITLFLNSDANDVLDISDLQNPLFHKKPFKGHIIYTGLPDELFKFKFGRLSYRSLDFISEIVEVDEYQPASVVNYTISEKFTRITEMKKLTGQVISGKTYILKEFSKPYVGGKQIPYYPIRNQEDLMIYEKYKELADQIPNFYLLGRLGEFKYYNIDTVVERALELSDSILVQESFNRI